MRKTVFAIAAAAALGAATMTGSAMAAPHGGMGHAVEWPTLVEWATPVDLVTPAASVVREAVGLPGPAWRRAVTPLAVIRGTLPFTAATATSSALASASMRIAARITATGMTTAAG